LELVTQLLGHVLVSVAENLLLRFSKPSDIRKRLSTIEAYCVYYPLYVVISRLGKADVDLVERFAKSLSEDPSSITKVIPMISSTSPSKQLAGTEVREEFRRRVGLLYIPGPYLKDLINNVRDDVNRVLDLVKQGKLEVALMDVEEKFKKKYSEGDLQIPLGRRSCGGGINPTAHHPQIQRCCGRRCS
jgi:hypothetical protein